MCFTLASNLKSEQLTRTFFHCLFQWEISFSGCDYFSRLVVSCCEHYITFVNTSENNNCFKLLRYKSQIQFSYGYMPAYFNQLKCILWTEKRLIDVQFEPKIINLEETKIKTLKQAKDPRNRHLLVVIGKGFFEIFDILNF